MKKVRFVLILVTSLLSISFSYLVSTNHNSSPVNKQGGVICNPINISYRFMPELPSRREAADPTVLVYKDEYYLFASKSGGYWVSSDLVDWKFIESNSIPTEEYAPTVVAIGDTVYFLASSNKKSTIYKSHDLKSGKWSVAVDSLAYTVWDPALFLDEDKKLYMYWGCSNKKPLYAVELDYKNGFKPLGKEVEVLHGLPAEHGWENPGDYNQITDRAPWIEGAWMNKHNGTYYLQYAGPGTEFKAYSDGVYTAQSPLGPFTYQQHNPVACKPEGFMCGAGHGSTFQDKYGNYWHIATTTISVKHMFERRLALFPAFFDKDGMFYVYTGFGDYPFNIPNKKIESPELTDWRLFSYDKKMTASSSVDTLQPSLASDENARTYWSAQSGKAGEWLMVDLGKGQKVNAIQVNFAEQNSKLTKRDTSCYYQYLIETSMDTKTWIPVVDKQNNKTDCTHDFNVLKNTTFARYVRITNKHVPDGNFAISDLRVFGIYIILDKTRMLNNQTTLAVKRLEDKRKAELRWKKIPNVVGYNIRYGISPEKLYHNYMVYGDTSVTIHNLNTNSNYFFAIDVFSDKQITRGVSDNKSY